VVGAGVGDSGGTVGAALDFRFGARSLALRAAVTFRVGEIPSAQITTQFVGGAMGLVWETSISPEARGAFGLRIDGVLLHADFAHLMEGDETIHQGKWMIGADVLAEGSWFFARGAAVAAGVGAEATFGRTDVRIGGRTFTTLTLLVRPLAELGLRIRF
jgi:hypothetical protein